MNWKLYSTDGEVVNTIVADEVFVAEYCEKHGYTFERMPDPEPAPEPEPVPEPETETSVWDELDTAYTEGVNSAYDQ